MPTPVVMPQMGESLSEGTITKWLKKPGDKVERDEPLFEITTDKVDTEVPAPAAGVLERILVNEGVTVAVGTTVAEIGERASATAAPAAPPPPPAETASGGGHFRSSHEPTTFQRRGASKPAPAQAPAATGGDQRQRLSPAVLSLASEAGLPLTELLQIPGTGRDGRISRRDVEQYLKNRSPRAEAAPPLSMEPSARAQGESRSEQRWGWGPGALSMESPPGHYLYQPEPGDRLVAMSPMRKQIAEHMVWSQRISAQVTSFTECDMHRVVRYREENRSRFEESEGVPLTFLPFVAEAAVRAMKEFPIFNASVVGDKIALRKHVHLGVAVALEEGLIVPVVRNAEEMNFAGLARAIHQLASAARNRKLTPADVRGASFTITNPGMFGGLTGTPMIAQPQVAILGLGAIAKKPVVIEDAITIRPIMVLALTFDHRIIDGATGFQFLERIRRGVEEFEA
jgi:2-oxoglutarate dehydrogenase E2 component (dihydrolipoamide succinyltransferase)